MYRWFATYSTFHYEGGFLPAAGDSCGKAVEQKLEKYHGTLSLFHCSHSAGVADNRERMNSVQKRAPSAGKRRPAAGEPRGNHPRDGPDRYATAPAPASGPDPKKRRAGDFSSSTPRQGTPRKHPRRDHWGVVRLARTEQWRVRPRGRFSLPQPRRTEVTIGRLPACFSGAKCPSGTGAFSQRSGAKP